MDGYQNKRPFEENADGNSSKRMAAADDDTVFRLLVPEKKIGSIIGKGGNIIKQLREESGARIKIADSVGGDERVVIISGKDNPSLAFSVAQDGLFRVHERVFEGELAEGQAVEGGLTTRMLVEGSQAGSLIGKGGEIIKMIREGSGAQVRVLPPDQVPPGGNATDRVVQIAGEVGNTRTCLQMISKQLRENPSKDRPFRDDRRGGNRAPPPPPQSYSQVPQYGTSGYSQGASQLMPLGGFVGMPTVPQLAQPPAPLPPSLLSPQISSRMSVSPIVIGSVIGKGGSNIQQIRTITGAKIKVHEKTHDAEDRIIEISGSADQVTQAQQLVQAFIANGSGAQQQSQGSYPY